MDQCRETRWHQGQLTWISSSKAGARSSPERASASDAPSRRNWRARAATSRWWREPKIRLRRAADDIARTSGRRVIAVPADASVPEAIIQRGPAGHAGAWWIYRYPGEQRGIDTGGRHRPRRLRQVAVLNRIETIRLRQICPARAAGHAHEQKWGRIVNVIGRSGHQPRPVYLAGGSVNAGLLNFTKALAEECAKDNILVTGVNPGPIDTPRWRSLRDAAVAYARGYGRAIRWPRHCERTAWSHRNIRGSRGGGPFSLLRARKFRDRRDC